MHLIWHIHIAAYGHQEQHPRSILNLVIKQWLYALSFSNLCDCDLRFYMYGKEHVISNIDSSMGHFYRGGLERMGPCPPPWVPLLISYGSSILSTSLGSNILNTSSLGLGGTTIKDPVIRRHLARIFHTPLVAFRRDAPALSWVRSPNNGKVGIKFLCPHSQCLGSYFDVIFSMYLAFLLSQPHSHQSSSSTQFSQEWVCRKVVVKHSIKDFCVYRTSVYRNIVTRNLWIFKKNWIFLGPKNHEYMTQYIPLMGIQNGKYLWPWIIFKL